MMHDHDQQPTGDGSFNGTLNVVIHGSVVLHARRSGSIQLYLADLAHEHAYLAGSHIVETGLRKGAVYRLVGIPEQRRAETLGSNHIELNLKDAETKPDINQALLYCRIALPWPNEVYPLQLLKYDNTVLTPGKEQDVAGVTVFVYRDCTLDQIAIEYGEEGDKPKILPWRKKVGPYGHVNLHIFAEAPVLHPGTAHARHLIEAFTQSVAMIRNAQGVIMVKAPTGTSVIGTLPAGLPSTETIDLATRSAALDEMFPEGLKMVPADSDDEELEPEAEEACAGGMRIYPDGD